MGDPGTPETHDQKTTRSHRTRTRKNMAKYISMPIRTTARAPYAEDDAVGDLRDDSYEYMETSRFPRPHVTSSRSFFRGISQNIYGTDCHVAYKITPIGKNSEATPRMGNTAHCLYFPAFFFLLFSRFDTFARSELSQVRGPGYELFRWGRHRASSGHQLHILQSEWVVHQANRARAVSRHRQPPTHPSAGHSGRRVRPA